jgi:hypothetical protein
MSWLIKLVLALAMVGIHLLLAEAGEPAKSSTSDDRVNALWVSHHTELSQNS